MNKKRLFIEKQRIRLPYFGGTSVNLNKTQNRIKAVLDCGILISIGYFMQAILPGNKNFDLFYNFFGAKKGYSDKAREKIINSIEQVINELQTENRDSSK